MWVNPLNTEQKHRMHAKHAPTFCAMHINEFTYAEEPENHTHTHTPSALAAPMTSAPLRQSSVSNLNTSPIYFSPLLPALQPSPVSCSVLHTVLCECITKSNVRDFYTLVAKLRQRAAA